MTPLWRPCLQAVAELTAEEKLQSLVWPPPSAAWEGPALLAPTLALRWPAAEELPASMSVPRTGDISSPTARPIDPHGDFKNNGSVADGCRHGVQGSSMGGSIAAEVLEDSLEAHVMTWPDLQTFWQVSPCTPSWQSNARPAKPDNTAIST